MPNPFDIDLWPDESPPEKPDKPDAPRARSTTVSTAHLFRRFTSERALDACTDWHLSPGQSVHVISGGDIDSLSYFRFIARQQKITRALCSTWCMAYQDIEELETMLRRGIIGHLDFYVGEIFKGSYANEWNKLQQVAHDYGSRLCLFRNHSKVYAGYGDKFPFVIESSANINTNPRTEQTVITTDQALTDFYFDFFSGIVNFDRDEREREKTMNERRD